VTLSRIQGSNATIGSSVPCMAMTDTGIVCRAQSCATSGIIPHETGATAATSSGRSHASR